MYSVRQATLDDIEFLKTQLKESDKACVGKYSLIPEEPELTQFISNLIEQHVFLIGMKHNDPIGYIAGYADLHLFNSKIKVLSELFWWVMPEFRASRMGSLLLKEFVRVAKHFQFNWVQLQTNQNTKIKDSNFKRFGFDSCGASYLMEI